jgi:CDP-4-dehydro-6-deoxyglucose reductase
LGRSRDWTVNAALQTWAQVESIRPLTDSITELVLLPETYQDYQAGQYLQISINQQWLSYSIANAPLGSRRYELHIRHDAHNASNQALFREIKEKGQLLLQLPFGHSHIGQLDPLLPIIFIAGGTGLAPIKAIIEQLLANADSRAFELYWGARSQSDLYMDEKLRQWMTHVAHFRYYSLLTGTEKKEKLTALLAKNHSQAQLKQYQMVIAGPFEMALDARKTLLHRGLAAERLHSDAF